MREKGLNNRYLKNKNKLLILNLLRKNGTMSRKQIAKKLRLTPAAITKISNEMIASGVLYEAGELIPIKSQMGRKERLLAIQYSSQSVIGVNIGFLQTSIGVSTLDGVVLQNETFDTNLQKSPTDFLLELAQKIKTMMWNLNIRKDNILGVGVILVGTVDALHGIVEGPFGIWHQKVDVKSILEDALERPVTIENNVRAAALTDAFYGTGDAENMLFIRLGYGIGSAVLLHGNIVVGQHNQAGELGHITIDERYGLCRCGKCGCLECVSSERAIFEQIKRLFSKDKTPQLYQLCDGRVEHLTVPLLLQASAFEDAAIYAVLEHAARILGIELAKYIALLDPNMIVLHGDLFKNEVFYHAIKESIKKELLLFDENRFVVSALNEKAPSFLGIATALQRLFFDA